MASNDSRASVEIAKPSIIANLHNHDSNYYFQTDLRPRNLISKLLDYTNHRFEQQLTASIPIKYVKKEAGLSDKIIKYEVEFAMNKKIDEKKIVNLHLFSWFYKPIKPNQSRLIVVNPKRMAGIGVAYSMPSYVDPTPENINFPIKQLNSYFDYEMRKGRELKLGNPKDLSLYEPVDFSWPYWTSLTKSTYLVAYGGFKDHRAVRQAYPNLENIENIRQIHNHKNILENHKWSLIMRA